MEEEEAEPRVVVRVIEVRVQCCGGEYEAVRYEVRCMAPSLATTIVFAYLSVFSLCLVLRSLFNIHLQFTTQPHGSASAVPVRAVCSIFCWFHSTRNRVSGVFSCCDGDANTR